MVEYIILELIFILNLKDGNGFINRQELSVVMSNLGEKLTSEEIQVNIAVQSFDLYLRVDSLFWV